MIFKTIIKRIFKITLTTKLNLWLMIGTFATDDHTNIHVATSFTFTVHNQGTTSRLLL